MKEHRLNSTWPYALRCTKHCSLSSNRISSRYEFKQHDKCHQIDIKSSSPFRPVCSHLTSKDSSNTKPREHRFAGSDSRDDTLTKMFPYWDSLSATGMQKHKNRGINIFLPELVRRTVLESLSLLSPPVAPLAIVEIGSTMFIALCLSYSCDTHLPA